MRGSSTRGAVARSSGTALWVGAGIGTACLAAGLGIGGQVGAAFAGLGLVLPGNQASIRVLEKVGMRRDGSVEIGELLAQRWMIEH